MIGANAVEKAQHRLGHEDLSNAAFIEKENLNESEKLEEKLPEDLKDAKETKAILVEGFNAKTNQEMVELFFENTKRSGGGEVTDIKMCQGSGSAVIWFAESAGKKLTQTRTHFSRMLTARLPTDMNRQTDTTENITFPQLRWRAVNY